MEDPALLGLLHWQKNKRACTISFHIHACKKDNMRNILVFNTDFVVETTGTWVFKF